MDPSLRSRMQQLAQLCDAMPPDAAPWYADGVLHRAAPLMELLAPDPHLALFRDCRQAVAALVAGTRVDPANLRRRLKAMMRPERTGEHADLADLVLYCAWTSLPPDRPGDHPDPRRISHAADALWEHLDQLSGGTGGWHAREVELQLAAARLLAPGTPTELRDRARRLDHDPVALAALARAVSTGQGWPLRVEPETLLPVPPPPRHPGCGEHPPAAYARIVAAGTGHGAALAGYHTTGRPVPFTARPGDVVTVDCPFGETVVTRRDQHRTWVGWPWPGGPGTGAELPGFAHDPAEAWQPVQLRPVAGQAAVGERVRVGVAALRVYVLRAYTFTPGRQNWFDKAAEQQLTAMAMLPAGRPATGDGHEAGEFDPYEMPLSVLLEWRAYPFLEPGDLVADAQDRELTFQPPLLFTTATGEPVRPAWPLRLLRHDGAEPAAKAVDAVAAATTQGCHDLIADAWEQHARVTLPDDLPTRHTWFHPHP
ncbi:hypothetical protein Cs7R123_77880 [Catellatospora sp. TT07R-123]|uniref:hypothetical protein n=1 Tax=Catellatospora sp. TT07R-123 TaxID=2733863 RepID=UPI001B10F73E|nr:hypothetical protein [Catellatospora sp. TT07R-123]GHJ50446.1 hypothetical protein Cs7R123_77880 [Catellatospora sp. TT07R-123]